MVCLVMCYIRRGTQVSRRRWQSWIELESEQRWDRPVGWRASAGGGAIPQARAAPLGAVPAGQHDRGAASCRPPGIRGRGSLSEDAQALTHGSATTCERTRGTPTDPVHPKATDLLDLQRHRNLLRNGPHKAHQFARHRDDDLVGVFPTGHEAAKAFAQPDLGLPTEILNRFWPLFESHLKMAAHLSRIAVGPSPFDQCPPGLGVARFGETSLATSVSTGIC
jgi:hypothetical protein